MEVGERGAHRKGTRGPEGGQHIKVVSAGERLGTTLQEGIVNSPKECGCECECVLEGAPQGLPLGAAFLICHVLLGPFQLRWSLSRSALFGRLLSKNSNRQRVSQIRIDIGTIV